MPPAVSLSELLSLSEAIPGALKN